MEETNVIPDSGKTEEVNPLVMPRETLDKLQREEPAATTETATAEEKAKIETEKKTKAETKVEAKAEEKPTEKKAEDEVSRVKAENEKLLNAVKNQDKLLAKLGTELGLLRKKTPEEENAEIETIRDAYLVDPINGDRLLTAYKEQKKKEESVAAQHQFLQTAKEVREEIIKDIPAFEENLAGIAELIKEDGADESTVNAFRQSPYIFGREVLINLAKRNEAIKKLKSAEGEIAKLKEENEEWKKRPDEMLKKIEKAAGTSVLSAKSGGAGHGMSEGKSKTTLTMSREELQKQARGG